MNVIEKKRMSWEFVITVKFLPIEPTLSLSGQNVTDKPKEYNSFEYAEIPTWALVYESYHFHNAKFDKILLIWCKKRIILFTLTLENVTFQYTCT